MFSVFLLALSLSMDAAAAAVCCGVNARGLKLRDGVVIGLWFGGFQTGMTWIGGLFGSLLSQRLWQLGSLLAFGLLTLLGCRMVWEGLAPAEGDVCPRYDLRPGPMAVLALATSLDALAAGLSLAYLDQALIPSALLIGLVTFCLSLAGGMLGRRIGQRWNRRASVAGGLVLLGLGLRILFG
ncbi:MAG: manganese efflux pump MntP family protein [Candidatus Onthomonas sp.]